MTAAPALMERIQVATGVVRERTALQPQVGIILGTGLGGLAEEIAVEATDAQQRIGQIDDQAAVEVETGAERLTCSGDHHRPPRPRARRRPQSDPC